MDTVIRKQASFRLREDLLETLKRKAEEANRSLNNFVESTLMDAMLHEPNEETQKAMQESQRNEGLETLDMSHFKGFVESL